MRGTSTERILSNGHHSTNNRQRGHVAQAALSPLHHDTRTSCHENRGFGRVQSLSQATKWLSNARFLRGMTKCQVQLNGCHPTDDRQRGHAQATRPPWHDAGANCHKKEELDGFNDGGCQPSGRRKIAHCEEHPRNKSSPMATTPPTTDGLVTREQHCPPPPA